uniref:Spermatogenesis-associated protein 6 N-terminal domain-containing protein n=1 Tax=Graphocephala atropunctata TaxID=36148 RepID=A0A1B6KF50_9HEMI
MSRKAFHIGIDLDIHAVSCPGVWLCPKGDTMLRISMLGASAHTKRLEPSFPLLFHESFHFRKTLTGITSLAGLQAELARRLVHIQLVQWQVHGCRCVLLAAFCSPLSELLYPQPASRGLVAGVDVDLLMEPTPCFPGIISPKVEVSTKVVIEEMVNYPLHEHNPTVVNHKTLTSKKAGFRKEDKLGGKMCVKARTVNSSYRSRARQKPVCHTRPRVKCYYCKQRGEQPRRTRAGGEGEGGPCVCGEADQADTHYIPYCNRCGDVVEEHETKQGKIILKESSHNIGKLGAPCPCAEPQSSKSACDCNLCRRYHSLFKNSAMFSPDSVLSQSTEFTKQKNYHPSAPANKDKCPCCIDKSVGIPPRIQGGNAHSRIGGSCKQTSDWTNSTDDNACSAMDHLKRGPTKEEEYRNMFKADLETHYKKLYERVSRRNNRRES